MESTKNKVVLAVDKKLNATSRTDPDNFIARIGGRRDPVDEPGYVIVASVNTPHAEKHPPVRQLYCNYNDIITDLCTRLYLR